MPQSSLIPVVCDSRGQFALNVPRRGDVLHLFHPYEPVSAMVSFDEQWQDQEITLLPEQSALGIVTDQHGELLSNVPVTIEYEIDHIVGKEYRFTKSIELGTVITRADGTYRFVGVPAGRKCSIATLGRMKSTRTRQKRISTGKFDFVQSWPERKAIKLTNEVLGEVREIARIRGTALDVLPDRFTALTLQDVISDQEQSKDGFTMICFGLGSSSLAQCQLAQQLYGRYGLRVIGVAGPDDKMVDGTTEQDSDAATELEVFRDLEASRLWQLFRVRAPCVLAYDSQGHLIANITRQGSLLWEARNLLFYGATPDQ